MIKVIDIRSDVLWCWIDEQSELLDRQKSQYRCDSVLTRLHARQELLDSLSNWLRELEIDVALDLAEQN